MNYRPKFWFWHLPSRHTIKALSCLQNAQVHGTAKRSLQASSEHNSQSIACLGLETAQTKTAVSVQEILKQGEERQKKCLQQACLSLSPCSRQQCRAGGAGHIPLGQIQQQLVGRSNVLARSSSFLSQLVASKNSTCYRCSCYHSMKEWDPSALRGQNYSP